MHKTACHGSIEVSKMGLLGDEQADRKNHGGADKAVFVMPMANYERFGIARPFGFLGENLTVSGPDETQVCLGDRLQIDDLLLEVMQPRSPCWKLGQQACSVEGLRSASDFLNVYSESGRVGFYCRVLQTGAVQMGDELN